MKKKCIRFLPLLLACLLLGGCFLEPAEGLYAVPKQSEEYYDLQNAIELALPDGAVYAPPGSGDNQQVVQMVDLDGDGEDEAVVYCKTTGELPLGIYVFDRQNDAFTLAASVQGAGSAFHHVSYVSFDDQPGYELVVGRQISDQVPQLMNVYSLRGGTLTELMSTEYAEFVTADLDADSRQEIVVLHSGGDSQNGIAELYCWADGQLKREREVSMSVAVSSVKRILTGYMCRNVAAVFVASEYSDGSLITDIFVFRDGVFTNLSRSEDANTDVQTLRDYYIYGGDIDKDGLIELPMLCPMPSLDYDASSQDQYLVSWYNLQLDGSRDEKLLTFHCHTGGWYLQIPTLWQEHLVLTRSAVAGSTLGYRFLWEAGGSTEELLTIAALSASDLSALGDGWQVLTQKGETVYVCRLARRAVALGITASYGTISSDDTDMMLILDHINLDGTMAQVNPFVGYFYRDNNCLGVRFGYRHMDGNLDAARYDLGESNDASGSIPKVNFNSDNYSFGIFHRSYAGLDPKGRFGLFAEFELSLSTGTSKLSYQPDTASDNMKTTFSDNTQLKLAFNPGAAVYIFPNVCATLSFGLGGIQYTSVTQKDDAGNKIGTRKASNMRFRLNVAAINFGMTVHLWDKKKK